MKKYLFLFIVLTASIGLVFSCSKPSQDDDNEDKITLSRVKGVWRFGISDNTLSIEADGSVRYSVKDASFCPNEDGAFHQGDAFIYSDALWKGYIDDQLIFHFTYQYIENKEVKYPNTFPYNPLKMIWKVASLSNSDMIMKIHFKYNEESVNTSVWTLNRVQ